MGLSDTKAATEFISRFLVAKTFEECIYPFYAVAINIGNGEKVIFNSKDLTPRVMASAAMPVFYEPVKIEGEYYCDGAIVDFAPADAICCKHNLDLVLIHHLAVRNYTVEQLRNSFKRPWTIVGILYRLIYRIKPWYETGNAISQHSCPCGCSAAIVVVEPRLPELMWPITKGGANIMDSAERQALDSLTSILK